MKRQIFCGLIYVWNPHPKEIRKAEKKIETSKGRPEDRQRAEAAETAQAAGGELSVSAPDSGPEHDWVLIASREQTEAPVKEQTYYNMDEEKAVKKVFEW